MSRVSYRLERAIVVLVALIAVLGVASATAAGGSPSADKVAVVKGGGKGVLTDPDGKAFPVRSFSVRGIVKDDGSANGTVRFVWRGSFPETWGDPVCEGTCDRIVLNGDIESGSVAADGTVTLSGTAREVDKRRGKVVFDSGFDEPFYVVVGGSQSEKSFILQWCLLPEFQIEGSIRVKADDEGHGQVLAATASSLAGASCARGGASS